MDTWDARYAHLRRATTGRNVLGWLALFFLCGFGYFWGQVWWPIFVPPSLLSPQATITVIISIVYTVVLPLFLSMVVPNSPAGRLLQKQTWAIPGQVMIVCLTTLLIAVALYVFKLWLEAQPGVMETGMFYPALLAMVSGGIGVPALTWAVMTPEQLLALYRQARISRALEYQAQLEDLQFKALHARFVAVVNTDMHKLTIAQFGAVVDEMTTILATGARQEGRRYRALADTFKQIYGVELATSDDPSGADRETLDLYREIGSLLKQAADNYVQTADYGQKVIDVTPRDTDRAALYNDGAQLVAETRQAAHVNTRSQSSIPRATESDSARQSPAEADSVYRAIKRDLPRVFTAKNLADLMQWQDKRPAQRTIAVWVAEGLVREVQLGRYILTESEAAQ